MVNACYYWLTRLGYFYWRAGVRVNIDISVFLGSTSFGVVSGQLDLAIIPRAGDYINVMFPDNGVLCPSSAFNPLLKVESVVLSPGGGVAVSVEPVIVKTQVDTESVASFLFNGFQLTIDRN